MPVSASDAFLGTGGVQVNRTQSLPASSTPTQEEHRWFSECQGNVASARTQWSLHGEHRGRPGRFPGRCETKIVLKDGGGRGSEPAWNRGSELPAGEAC